MLFVSTSWGSRSQIDRLHNQAYALLESGRDKVLTLAKEIEDLAHKGGFHFEEANSLKREGLQ